MAQIIPRSDIGSLIGRNLGTGLSQGINTGVNALLNQKLEQMNYQRGQQRANALLEEANIGKEWQPLFRSLPPEKWLDTIATLGKYGASPFAQPLNNLGTQAPETGQQFQPAEQIPTATTTPSQKVTAPTQPPSTATAPALPKPGYKSPAEAFAGGQVLDAATRAKIEENRYQKDVDRSIKREFHDADIKLKRDIHKDNKAHKKQDLKIKEAKNEREKDKVLSEFSKPYIESREASEKNIRDEKNLLKLAQSGKLRSGNAKQFADKFGFGDIFRNYETQLAEKIIARLAQNVGSAFGRTARLTNYLEQTYQRSIASLWNTDEGIVGITQLMMAADEANVVLDDTRKQVMRENPDLLPSQLDDKIRERAKPKLEKLENDAINLISKGQKTEQYSVGQNWEELPRGNFPINAEITTDSGKKLYFWAPGDWRETRKGL